MSRVWATSATADPVPGNDAATVGTVLAAPAALPDTDLELFKTGPARVGPGDTIVYTIRIRNRGPSIAEEVLVTDLLPANATFLDASAGGVHAAGTVRWPVIRVLHPTHGATFTVRVVAPGCGQTLVNRATVTAQVPRDLNLANNTDSVTTVIAGEVCDQADVAIVKDGPPVVDGNATLTWVLRVTNRGPAPAFNVVVTDTLPPIGQFISANPAATLDTLAGPILILTWPAIPVLAPGATQLFTVTFRAPPSAPGGLRNVATVRAANPPDPDTTNNVSEFITRVRAVTQAVDVEVMKTGPDTVTVSDTIVYRIAVKNRGPIAAGNVLLTDTLPHAGTFVSATGSPTRAGRVLTWPAIASLAAGDSVVHTIRYVATPCPEMLINVATIRAPEDSVSANNRSEVRTVVRGAACAPGLNVAKVALDTFRVGATGRFRISVTNTGNVPMPGPITVTDTLAPGLTFVSGAGQGWTVTAAGPVVTGVHAGSLDPGRTASFEVTVAIGQAAVPRVCNRAWAAAGGLTVQAPEICVLVEFGELTLRKAASRTEAEIGDILEYRLVLRLNGNAPVRGVFVTDALPTGFRYIAGTARIDGRALPDPAGAPGPVLAFDVGTVQPGRDVEITYRVLVGPGTPIGDAINRARASGGGKTSNEATSRVRIRAGIFSDEGMIVGKIFLDSVPRAPGDTTPAAAGDRRQRAGEIGIPGVRVWLQDGTSALTDRDGEFLFYALRPRTWIVKVDTSTLPEGARLEALTTRHARDGGMLQVDLKKGELHRADFAVRADPLVSTDVTVRAHVERRRNAWEAVAVRLEARPFLEGNPAGVLDAGVRLRVYEPLLPDVAAGDLDRRIRGLGLTGGWSPDTTGAGSIEFERGTSVPRAATDSAGPVGFGSALAIGLVEGRIDFRSLTDVEIGGRERRNRFEDELRAIADRSDDGRRMAGARAALFLRGEPADGYGLTLRLDSERDDRLGLFRDIRPDDFYPVYGDASIRAFGAQSRSRVFGMLEKGASYFVYGDLGTVMVRPDAGGGAGPTGLMLGEYARSVNGALQHWEREWGTVTAWASRERSRQVVDVIRGLGISGPYALSRTDGLVNSERVELVTRDRNQPSTILRVQPLLRFLDYTVEPLTGRLIFQRPVPSHDEALNPVEIRVTYEVETGGDRSWAWGAAGQFRPAEFLEVGGNIVRDDNGLERFDLRALNATVGIASSTYLTGEFARTETGQAAGDATRIELRHETQPLAARVFFLDVDPTFRNPTSPIGRGRRELGFLGGLRLATSTRLLGEALRTEDVLTDGTRTGARIAIEQAFSAHLRGQLSFRHAEETSPGADPDAGPTPNEVDAVGVRLQARLPGLSRAAFWGEFEQDIGDADRRRAEIAGEYAIPGLRGVRLYARHELISSFTGPWGLTPDQERNTTVLGVAVEDRAGQGAFSEYRVGDATSGREAQAAVGLRNSWRVSEGVRLGTSFERVAPVGTTGPTATAVTGAVELTGAAAWKSSARLEFRTAGEEDHLFGSIGYVRRLSDDWTFLGRSAFSTILDDGRAFERTRLGVAWRQTERNVWNGLARYEHRWDRNPDTDSVPTTRTAHILAAHADFRPVPWFLLRGEWASKFATEDLRDLSVSEAAHVAGARLTVDVMRRLDLGLIGRTLFSGTGGTRFGLGAELGVLLADNLRLAGGYNVFGFRDRELSAEEHTDRGFYVQFGFKFDEGLFDRRGIPVDTPRPPPQPQPTDPETPTNPPAPDPGDLRIGISGPNWVLANDTLPPPVRDTILWIVSVRRVVEGAQGRVLVRARLTPALEVGPGPAGRTVTGGELVWELRDAGGRGFAADTLRVPVPNGVPADSVVRIVAWLDGVPPDRNPANDTARFATTIRGRCSLPAGADPPVCPADLMVGIFGPGAADTAEVVDYLITTRNIGGVTAESVDLRVDPPAAFAVLAAPGAVQTPTGLYWAPDTLRGGPSGIEGGPGTALAGRIRDLAPGEAASVRLSMRAPAGAGSFVLVARTNTRTFEADLSNNVARHPIGVGVAGGDPCAEAGLTPPPACMHDLSVFVDAERSAFEDDTVAFVLRTENVGPQPVADILLTAAIGDTRFVRASGDGSRDGETITWQMRSALAAGGVRADTLWVVCPPAGITVNGTVSGARTELDRDPGNNMAGAAIPCAPNLADLAVRIDRTGGPVRTGGNVTWVITTTNLGRRPALGVRLEALLPLAARFQGATPEAQFDGRTARWTLSGPLAPGASVRHTLVVRAPAVAGPILVLAVSTTTTAEVALANNRGRLETDVVAVVDPPPDPVTDVDLRLGTRADDHEVTVDVFATNLGPVRAAQVALTATWPDSVAFVRASGDWTVEGNTIRWQPRASLGVLETARESLVVRAPEALPGPPQRYDVITTASTTTREVILDNNRANAMLLLQQVTITDTVTAADTLRTWLPIVEPRWFPWALLFLLALIALSLVVLVIRWLWPRPPAPLPAGRPPVWVAPPLTPDVPGPGPSPVQPVPVPVTPAPPQAPVAPPGAGPVAPPAPPATPPVSGPEVPPVATPPGPPAPGPAPAVPPVVPVPIPIGGPAPPSGGGPTPSEPPPATSPPAPAAGQPPAAPPGPTGIPPIVVLPPTGSGPAPPPPAGPIPVVIPPLRVPGHPDGNVYGHITIDGGNGTGFLVDPHRFVTSARLVRRRRRRSGKVILHYDGRELDAEIESIDVVSDVAILRTRERIEGVKPLEFAPWIPRLMPLDGYAFVGSDPQAGTPVRGVVIDAAARDRFGRPTMTILAPELAEAMLDPDHARAGGPLFVDGLVVGHVRGRVPHPDTLTRTFAGMVHATPASRTLELMGRKPPTSERTGERTFSDVIRDACCPEHRAFIRHSAADTAFAERIANRLEGTGFRVFLAQHEAVPMGGPVAAEREALERSGAAVIVQSRHAPPDDGTLETIAQRAASNGAFRTVVARTDDSEVPELLRDQPAVDFCSAPADAGDQVHELERALIGELDARQEQAWSAIARATDDVVTELHDARGRAQRLRHMALRWRESGLPTTQPDLLAAELLLETNRPDLAREVLARVPDALRGDGARIRQLEARALLDGGHGQEATALLDALHEEGRLDGRTANRYADWLVDRWVRGAHTHQGLLRRAFDLLHAYFERTGDPETGARAASQAMLLGHADEARTLAGRVRAVLEARSDIHGGAAAAYGQVQLLLGQVDDAVEWFERAVGADPDDVEQIGNLGRRIRRVVDSMGALLPDRDAVAAKLATVFRLPRIAAFGLPPLDPAMLGSTSLTADEEAVAEHEIRERVRSLDVGYGIGCITGGLDLLLAEEILRSGGRLRILLPYARNAYIPLVALPDIAARIERVLAHAATRVFVTMDQVPPPDRTTDAFVHCTSEILRVAEEEAGDWGEKPVLLAYGDGGGLTNGGVGLRLAGEDFEIVRLLDVLPEEPETPTEAEAGTASPPDDGSAAAVEPARAPVAAPAPAAAAAAPPDGQADGQARTRDARRRPAAAPRRQPRGYAKLHLLAVGIDKYTEWPELSNAVSDVNGVVQALESRFGFESSVLLNEEATRTNINRLVIDELSERVEADDLFVFFFAGHGHTERLHDDEEHGYLVPVDAREGSKADLMRMEDVASWTENLASNHVLYIFDSCFSGVVAMTPSTRRGGTQDARVAIAAGTAEQVVLDGSASGGPSEHSVFTGYLLQCLADPEQATGGMDLDDYTLYHYLRSQVEAATKGAQSPVRGSLPGSGNGIVRFPKPLTP